MAERIDKATAASVTMKLNGIDWTVCPINFRDLGLFSAWLRQKVMSETISACAGLDKAVAEIAIREAQNPTRAALDARAAGPDADLYIAWLSIRKGQPTITLDDVADQLPTLADVQAISTKAVEIGGGSFGDGGKPAGNGF